MTKVFISHSSKDARFAAGYLKPLLEQAGFDVWCSSADLDPGLDWERQLREQLHQTDWLLVVLSPDAAQSEWVRAEIHWAIENLAGRILPLLVRACNPSNVHLRLGTMQFLDFRIDLAIASQQLLHWLQDEQPQHRRLASGEATLVVSNSGLCHANLHFKFGDTATATRKLDCVICGEAIIGRAPDADLHIPSNSVSRRHARLLLRCHEDHKEVEINDLRSTNGTFVNDHPIVTAQRLSPGDILRLGTAQLHFIAID